MHQELIQFLNKIAEDMQLFWKIQIYIQSFTSLHAKKFSAEKKNKKEKKKTIQKRNNNKNKKKNTKNKQPTNIVLLDFEIQCIK